MSPSPPKIIIVTQVHPDKTVERYRRFALAKLAKEYPVTLVGSAYAFAKSESKDVILAPFLYDSATKSLDWALLQDWMRQENIDGVWFYDYEDVITTPPALAPEVTRDTLLIVQSPCHRERRDQIGTHHLYGPVFLGADVIAKIDVPNLRFNHWMRWRLLLAAIHRGAQPKVVLQDYNLLIFLDCLPFGTLQDHWQEMRAILAQALQLPDAATKFADSYGVLKDITKWCDNHSDASLAKHVGAPELFRQIVLPLKSVLRQLLEPVPPALTSPEPQPIPLDSVKSIGIIKLDNIGDGLLMTPMLRQLRARFKGEIRLLCSYQQYDFWKNCPEIDRLEPFDKKHIADGHTNMLSDREYQRNGTDWIIEYAAAFAEKAVPFFEGCEAILLPRGGPDYYGALNTGCLTSASWRIMNFHPGGREHKWNRGFEQNITHIVLRTLGHPHEADSLIDLLTAFGMPVTFGPRQLYFWATEDDKAVVRNIFHPNQDKKQVVLATGTTWKSKTWPIEYFIRLAQLLKDHLDYEIVLIGSDSEREINKKLVDAAPVPVHDLTARLTVPQTIHMMTRCHLLIGGNSAPVHMGSAALIPRVEVQFHAKTGHPDHVNSPLRFGNIGDNSIIIQPEKMAGPPCVEACYSGEAHCIKGVTPEMVLEAALKLLGSRPERHIQSVLHNRGN